jgi:hypothetical protein
MSDINGTLQKAQLVPIDPNSKQALMDQAITVHFNPETLKLSYTITVKADTGSKNSSSQASQQSSSSSAKLAVDLVFDTTDLFEDQQDNADVTKVVTGKIVSAFVAPPDPQGAPGGKPVPANPCLFLWGTFQFVGLVDSYNETLEFFSASGVPLRSAVSLSLTQSRYKVSNIPQRTPGVAQPLPPNQPISPALSSAGQDPTDWRGAALGNGLETPRFSAGVSLNVGIGADVSASASASGGAGFSVGASADLGTAIPGAFSASSGGAGFSASASFGASLG